MMTSSLNRKTFHPFDMRHLEVALKARSPNGCIGGNSVGYDTCSSNMALLKKAGDTGCNHAGSPRSQKSSFTIPSSVMTSLFPIRESENLPSSSNSSGGSRQMSPSEGRELDELMLMARQLAASSSTTCGSSPTESISSGSSKESPKSPSDGPSPPLSFFFSGLRRRRSVDKKTLVDGLKTTTLSVDVVHQTFGTDEQAALNQLVASNSPPPPATEGDSVPLEGPSTRRKGFELRHLHQEIESSSTRHPPPVEGHRHRQLNTLPESHQEEISELVVWPLVPEHVSSSSMPKVVSKRSLSESERSAPFEEFRVELTSSTATTEAKLAPINSVPGKGSYRSTNLVPESSSAVASDSSCPPPRPPPPLPPRIPIRPSTVSKPPHQRRNELISSSSTSSKAAFTIDCNKGLQQLPHFH